MTTQTVADIRDKKLQLELFIGELITNFENETGLRVDGAKIFRVDMLQTAAHLVSATPSQTRIMCDLVVKL